MENYLSLHDDAYCVITEADIEGFLLEGKITWHYMYRHFFDFPAQDWDEVINVEKMWGAGALRSDFVESSRTDLGIILRPIDTCKGKCHELKFAGSGTPWALEWTHQTSGRTSLSDWVAGLVAHKPADATFVEQVSRLRVESSGNVYVGIVVPCECEEPDATSSRNL